MTDIAQRFMDPEVVAAQDAFMVRMTTEMRLLEAERPLPPEASALTGFVLFCAGCMKANVNPREAFQALVDYRD